MRKASIFNWDNWTGMDFQALCTRLLDKEGFETEDQGVGPDDGMDILVKKLIVMPIGSSKIYRWVVQAKFKRNPSKTVSPSDLEDIGNLLMRHRADGFLLITNARVTNKTKDIIRAVEHHKFGNYTSDVWDGSQLEGRILKHNDLIQQYFPQLLAHTAHIINPTFYNRVLDLSRIREESKGRTVTFQPRQGPTPFDNWTVLTWSESPTLFGSYTLAALPKQPDKNDLKKFRSEVHEVFMQEKSYARSKIVYQGPQVDMDLAKEYGNIGISLISFTEHEGLIDFNNYLKGQTDQLKNDPLYPPDLYIPHRICWRTSPGQPIDMDAVAEIRRSLIAPHSQLILLSGDAGSGKTYALHKLALDMEKSEGQLIPILIDMKKLEKLHSLDEIMSQHLIKSLGRFDRHTFKHMLKEGYIALLFDGFDELSSRMTYDKVLAHFDMILEAAVGKAKVVVSTRSQHFLSDVLLISKLYRKAATMESFGFKFGSLQLFDNEQIRSFINKHSENEADAQERYSLLERFPDLHGLCANPQMLAFISTVPLKTLHNVTSHSSNKGIAKLYKLLVNEWLKREFNKPSFQDLADNVDLNWLWKCVTKLAIMLINTKDHKIQLGDKDVELAKILKQLTPEGRTREEFEFIMGSGTLLTRDNIGQFYFIHDSVMEFLVGKAAADELLNLQEWQTCVLDMPQQPTQMMTDTFIAMMEDEDNIKNGDKDVFNFLEFDMEYDGSLLLQLCVCFATEEIPNSLIVKITDLLMPELKDLVNQESDLEELTDQLVDHKLAFKTADGLRIPSLIRALVRKQAPVELQKKWAKKALRIIAENFPTEVSRLEDQASFHQLTQHALSVTSYAIELSIDDRVSQLLDVLGRYSFIHGNYKDAQSCFERLREIIVDADAELLRIKRSICQSNMCVAEFLQDDSKNETSHLSSVLETQGVNLSLDHNHWARVHANLGHALHELGQKDAAIKSLRRSYELVSPRKNLQAGPILDSIGVTLFINKKFDDAIQCLQTSQSIIKDTSSEKLYDPAQAIRSWLKAQAYSACKQEGKAEREKDVALSVWKNVLKALSQLAGDKARSKAVVLGRYFKNNRLSIGMHRELLDFIVDELEKKANGEENVFKTKSDKLDKVKGELAYLQKGGGDAESIRANADGMGPWVDLEAEALDLKKEKKESRKKADHIWQTALLWRNVIDSFYVRYTLQIPDCGLCDPKDCPFQP